MLISCVPAKRAARGYRLDVKISSAVRKRARAEKGVATQRKARQTGRRGRSSRFWSALQSVFGLHRRRSAARNSTYRLPFLTTIHRGDLNRTMLT